MAPKEQQLFVEMSDGTCKSLLPIEDEDEGDYIGVKKIMVAAIIHQR